MHNLSQDLNILPKRVLWDRHPFCWGPFPALPLQPSMGAVLLVLPSMGALPGLLLEDPILHTSEIFHGPSLWTLHGLPWSTTHLSPGQSQELNRSPGAGCHQGELITKTG